MSGGLWWTWIISSGLFGLFVGFFRKQIGEFKGEVTKKELIVFNVVQIVSNLVIWGLIAPVGDVLIYKDNPNKVFLQGVVAGSFNALTVAVAGSLLLIHAYARTFQTKDGSYDKRSVKLMNSKSPLNHVWGTRLFVFLKKYFYKMQDIYCKIENIVYNKAIKTRKENHVAKNLKLKNGPGRT